LKVREIKCKLVTTALLYVVVSCSEQKYVLYFPLKL